MYIYVKHTPMYLYLHTCKAHTHTHTHIYIYIYIYIYIEREGEKDRNMDTNVRIDKDIRRNGRKIRYKSNLVGVLIYYDISLCTSFIR